VEDYAAKKRCEARFQVVVDWQACAAERATGFASGRSCDAPQRSSREVEDYAAKKR